MPNHAAGTFFTETLRYTDCPARTPQACRAVTYRGVAVQQLARSSTLGQHPSASGDRVTHSVLLQTTATSRKAHTHTHVRARCRAGYLLTRLPAKGALGCRPLKYTRRRRKPTQIFARRRRLPAARGLGLAGPPVIYPARARPNEPYVENEPVADADLAAHCDDSQYFTSAPPGVRKSQRGV